MLGKTPRKSAKATAASIPRTGGKNIQKIKQQSQKKYPKPATLKIPKSSRKFSLASDSSLSSVSDEGRNFHNMPVFDSSSDEEEKNMEMNAIMGPSSSESGDDDDDDDDDMSSEDDSDIDFVLLTKEKKARAIKAAKSRKTPRKSNKARKYPKEESKAVEEKEDEEAREVDFQFHFDSNGNETFKIGEKKEEDYKLEDEEDLGEEIPDSEFKLIDNSYDSNVLQDDNLLKNHLMMDVPKIKDDEINSDEDYEIDDAQLIQTLQNDNDDLELAMDDDDDYNSEPGDELLDANEFDNLSFEGEEDIDDYDELIENAMDDNEDENDDYLLKEETNAITKDFDSLHTIRLNMGNAEDEEEDGFLKYLSEDSVLFDNDDEDGEDDEDEEGSKILSSDIDEDDYELTFFYNPFKDVDMNNRNLRRSMKTSKRKFSVNDDSRNEFHWPYMKKSDGENESGSSEYSSDYDDEDEVEDDKIQLKLITELKMHSGDSTDEDTSLPTKKAGSKLNGGKMVAKEILSTSETVPPLLGKWKTSENTKPFGIIDGLSTRSLQPEFNPISLTTGSSGNCKKGRSTSFSLQKAKLGATEEPMLLDDLLNMSELEDGDTNINETDAIGYISTKKIPLSLFRNKGYVPSVVDSMDQLKKYSMNNRKLINILDDPDTLKLGHSKHINFKFDDNSMVKKSKKKKKEKKLNKMRKQSVVEAAKEGLRTTKSGLFSENTIADVELFLADVDTGDEFSILFKEVI